MKILFVSLSNVGDAVLSVPTLHCLSEAYPKASIDVVVGPRAKVVFEKDTRIAELIVLDKKSLGARWRFFKQVRARRYDMVVDLRRSFLQFTAKKRFTAACGFGKHKRDEHLSALARLGLGSKAGPGELPYTEADFQSASSHLVSLREPGPLVVIAPGSRSDLKRWREDRFAALASRLVSLRRARVVWIGDESERSLAERASGAAAVPSVNLAGRLTWHESVALISRADLVITNDSAPLHVADQMGRKVLSFFGPTDPAEYGPQRTHGGALFRGLFCSPCKKAQCRYGRECLDDISVDEAWKRAVELLDDEVEKKGMKILVVRLDRIGDVLLSLGAFAAIRQKYPNARISALVRPHARAIPERIAEVSETLVYDYGKAGRHRSILGYLRLVGELRRKHFDVAFVLHPTLRSHLLCLFAGIPLRIGVAAEGGGQLLTHKIADHRADGLQHESHNVLDVLAAFGIQPSAQSTSTPFQVFPEDTAKASSLLAASGITPGTRYAVFHAGSSSRSKEWPAGYFVELAKGLARVGFKTILVGGAETSVISRTIATGSGAVDLTGRTDLPSLAAIFRGAAVVVSNDSGPAHLAAAVGAPVISIFGRKEPGLGPVRWRPLGPRSRALQKDAGCVVCLADACPISFECLKLLKPEEVLREALQLIAQPTSLPKDTVRA